MRPIANSGVTAKEFYDLRHEAGWVDHWPEDRCQRVVRLISEMDLPKQAQVLEFGCGVGVFADAVKTAFPLFDVHGCDISSTAILKARQRAPSVHFDLLSQFGESGLSGMFDLVYSHHVLEHVADLDATLTLIGDLVKPHGKVLHILPSANPGSLDWRIAAMVRDGIAPSDAGGLFYSDDTSHVRRLSSDQLITACRATGLVPIAAFFGNQFWGSIEYLTDEYHWTLLDWLNPRRGTNAAARVRLMLLLFGLGVVSAVRKLPRYILVTLHRQRQPWRKLLVQMLVPLAIAGYPASRAVERLLTRARECEWRRDRTRPNGSEMYLVFQKAET